jgi:hypothetical protein
MIRMRLIRITASLGVLTLLLAGGQLATAPAAAGAGPGAHGGHTVHRDLDTISQNLMRDGWDADEPGLSPAAVSGGGFGQLFATPVDGQVYAQPLVVDGQGATPTTTLIVATENDSVYSIDGTTGAVNWSVNLGLPWASSVDSCQDLAPVIGITSTPVYDQATGTVYVVADITAPPGSPATDEVNDAPEFYLYAISEQDGTVDWDKEISGSPYNDPSQVFNPDWQRQRAGLLEMDNPSTGDPWIYLAFGSVCDYGPSYAGYVAGVDTINQDETLWTDEADASRADPQAGIWMSGGGPVVMPNYPNSFFLTSGNGLSPQPGTGLAPTQQQFGDSVIRLDIQPDGTVAPGDFFSPADAPMLDATDRDFGSGGPVGLPFGTSAYPDLIAAAGKDGRVFLLNDQDLGGRGATADTSLSESGPYGGQWGHPAAFAGVGAGGQPDDYVYYSGTGWFSSDFMRVLQLRPGSATVAPSLTEVANTTTDFGYSSGSPVVTSNGTDPSSAVVWDVYCAGNGGEDGALTAFDAVPQAGVLKEIWSSPFTATISGKAYPVLASKFTVAATDDGRVYVGTRGDTQGAAAGYLLGYGLKSDLPFTGTHPVTFPEAGAGGQPSTASVTLTATEDLTVTAATLTATGTTQPFTQGTAMVDGTPVTSLGGTYLTTGQTLTVPLTFTPAAAGGFSGQLQVSVTDAAGATTASVQLSGTGTQPGVAASPATLHFGAMSSGGNDTNFGPVPIGTSEPIQTAITNTSTAPVQVTGIALANPGGPFSISAPTLPCTLAPGQSQVVTVTYTPTKVATANNPITGTMTVTNNSSSQATTVTLQAVSEPGAGLLSPSATSVPFGHVPLGTTGSAALTLTNTGNLPVTVTGCAAPGVPFGTPGQTLLGTSVAPGDAVTLPVTYTPQGGGSSTGSYQVTTTAGQDPARTLTIAVSGTAASATRGTVAVPGPGGGWTLDGSAAMTGTTLDLTAATANQAGSAVYYQPMSSNGLKATFTERSGGGTGGDGLTFSMLSPVAPGAALGGKGPALGYGGLKGVAVVVGTTKDAGFPSANFVGIATGTAGGHLVFAATSSAVPNMRQGTHVIGVYVAGATVSVTVNGMQYLSTHVPSLPASVLPAFTAGTSTADDVHAISAVSLTSPSAGLVQPPGGGWSYNGSAALSGSDTDLTQLHYNQAGAVVYPRAIATTSTSTMTAQFQVQIGGGTGANALTFALLNPGTAATACGADGSGLGLDGLTGMAVVLSTYPMFGLAAHNLVAVVTATAATASAPAAVTLTSLARVPVQQLRAGRHTVTVVLANGVLSVYLDGGPVAAAYATALAATSLPAFTASTGGEVDIHAVRNVALSASGW